MEHGVFQAMFHRRAIVSPREGADVVPERLKAFLPQIQAANGMLGEGGLDLEDVGEGEEYVEMVFTLPG
jgi:hypothetical protein